MEKVEGCFFWCWRSLLGLSFLSSKSHLFSQQRKVRVMSAESKHEKISIKAVEAVAGVGIIAREGLLMSDEVHDLVFSLTGRLVAGQDDPGSLPETIGGHLVGHEVLQLLVEPVHERRSRCDAIGVEPEARCKNENENTTE